MIELDDSLLVGRNQTRDVFQHPDHPDRVLKIEMRPLPGRIRWYERPPKIDPSLTREFQGYADMMIRLKRHYPFIARIMGLENTNRGTAILAEHVSYGATRSAILGRVIDDRSQTPFTHAELVAARALYVELSDLLIDHRVYTHGLRKENLMLVEMEGELRLRMFDFKTIVYRQLISPRYVPGLRLYEQRRKVGEVLFEFDQSIARHERAEPDRCPSPLPPGT